MKIEKYKITQDTAISISTDSFDKTKRIDNVELNIEGSSSRGRIFDIGLKLASLHWTDSTINKIEKIIDDRLVELTNGEERINSTPINLNK